jgi:GT2 family glycosyltransferase
MEMVPTETSQPDCFTDSPRTAVLICTRNRGDSILKTIKSVIANTYRHFELVIVDQSNDLCTERAIATFGSEPRLRYIHTNTLGKSRAQNIGLSMITTDYVILTDDDCEVPTNWIAEMVKPFLRYPQVGIVFCNVIPGPHDRSAGFIPDCISSRSFLIEDPAHWQTSDGLNVGIGAGMAIRRETAEAINGFSTLYGPGSSFRNGDDTDFTWRALVQGYQIYRTDTVDVVHYGFRTYEQGRTQTRNDMFSLGGIYGQLLRRGHLFALRRYASVFMVMVINPALNEMRHLRPPRVIGRINWLIRGLIAGLLITPRKPARGLSGIADH